MRKLIIVLMTVAVATFLIVPALADHPCQQDPNSKECEKSQREQEKADKHREKADEKCAKEQAKADENPDKQEKADEKCEKVQEKEEEKAAKHECKAHYPPGNHGDKEERKACEEAAKN